jgi:hypothetical protein
LIPQVGLVLLSIPWPFALPLFLYDTFWIARPTAMAAALASVFVIGKSETKPAWARAMILGFNLVLVAVCSFLVLRGYVRAQILFEKSMGR